MATQQNDDPYIFVFRRVRTRYLHVFEKFKPRNAKPGQEPKYNVKAIIPDKHPQLEDFKALMLKLVNESFSDKKMPKSDMRCLRRGEETDEFEANNWIVSANEDRRPYALNSDNTPTTAEDEILYPGCYVDLAVRIWPQDEKSGWGRRVNANFLGVRFAGHAERIEGAGARPDADALFGGSGGTAAFQDDEGPAADPFA